MISAFYWGTNYENILNFSYPLYDLVTDRPPRDGSDFVQGVSGLEDAWLTGYDYTLEGEMRYLQLGTTSPFSAGPGGQGDPLGGALSLQGFLDWCRAKNTVRFVPDFLNAPSFFVDGCYLADPVKGGGGRGLTSRLDWSQKFKFRNPSVDFALALRGLMFEYAPGLDLSSLSGAAVSRASVADYITNLFGISQAAAGTFRDRHYPLGTLGSRAGLYEASKVNSCLQSEAIDNATWTKTRTTVVANTAVAPDGNNTAEKLKEDASASTTHTLTQAITITSGEAIAISIFAKASERSRLRIQFADGGTTNGFNADANLGAGTINAGGGFGAGVISGTAITPLGNGWFRLQAWGRVNAGVTAGQLFILLADNSGNPTYTGDGTSGLFLWGAQVERNGIANGSFPNANGPVPPTSYIGPTTTVTVTRSADSVQYPFTFVPQPMFVYVKFIELGTLMNAGVVCGTAGGSNAALFWTTNPSAPLSYEFFHFRPGAPAVGSTFTASVPAYGQTVELLGMLNADASTDALISINGAADVAGSHVAVPQGFAAAWDGTVWDFGQTTGITGFQSMKIGPLSYLGQSVNTIAKARAL